MADFSGDWKVPKEYLMESPETRGASERMKMIWRETGWRERKDGGAITQCEANQNKADCERHTKYKPINKTHTTGGS